MKTEMLIKSVVKQTAGRLWLLALIAFMLILLPSSTVLAETSYPTRADSYVNDYAGVLDAASESSLQDMFQKLMDESGIEAVVVTINSVHDYQTGDDTIESFATHLFNLWGIGDYKKDNGILILVAVNDRECRIELGAGYGTGYDSDMQKVIDEYMVPYFKTGDYQTGIIEGSRHAIEAAKGNHFNWMLVVGAIVMIVALFLLFRFRMIGPILGIVAGIAGFLLSFVGDSDSFSSGGGSFSGGGHSFGGGASGHW